MTAAVDQRRDRAVAQARDNDRMPADVSRLVVALLGDLAGMPELDPCGVENPLHLQFEDAGIGIDVTVNGIATHQTGNIPHVTSPLADGDGIRSSSTPTSGSWSIRSTVSII